MWSGYIIIKKAQFISEHFKNVTIILFSETEHALKETSRYKASLQYLKL